MYTVGQLAEHADGEVVGDPSTEITGIGSLQSAKVGQISHLSSAQYKQHLASTCASAVLIQEADVELCPTNAIVVDSPYVAYAKVSQLFDRRSQVPIGVHETAFVDASANLGSNVRIGAFVYVGPEVDLGDNVEVCDHASIGAGCRVASETLIKSRALLCHGVKIGKHCVLMEGCVVGADGFGHATAPDGVSHAIAQLGSVRIGDYVDVGANATIDRGALDDTVIEDHVKMDDQVHIGHNCKIGTRTIVCGKAGFAGSVTIGADCVIGGGVGIAGDGPLTLTDRVYVGAMTFVSRSITESGLYSGNTLHATNSQWRRNMTRLNNLDALHKRVLHLEKLLNERLNA